MAHEYLERKDEEETEKLQTLNDELLREIAQQNQIEEILIKRSALSEAAGQPLTPKGGITTPASRSLSDLPKIEPRSPLSSFTGYPLVLSIPP